MPILCSNLRQVPNFRKCCACSTTFSAPVTNFQAARRFASCTCLVNCRIAIGISYTIMLATSVLYRVTKMKMLASVKAKSDTEYVRGFK